MVTKMPVTKEPKTAKVKASGLEVSVVDLKGHEVEKVHLPEELFGVKASDKLLAQYVRVYLANQRQGTRSTKTRSEIVGSTKKIYRQKGTGRARHGARKASLFVGGGVTHGPKPVDYSLKLNKKQKRIALLLSLTKKLKDKKIHFVKGLLGVTGKTKEMVSVLKIISDGNSKLIVYPAKDSEKFVFGARNIERITMREVSILNAYDVLKSGTIIFSREALDVFLKRINEN